MGPVAAIASDVLAPAVGSVLGPVLGDIGGALGIGGLGDIGSSIGGILNQAMKAFNPLNGLLQNFLPGLVPSSRPPFSTGGFNTGIVNNPLGNVGNLNIGGQSFSQLQSDVMNAAKSGDPGQMLAAQQKMDAYTEMLNMLTSMEKAMHDLKSSIARNIA